MLAMKESASAAGDVVEYPVDSLLHLAEGEAVSIRCRHVQELDACIGQRLGIVARLQPTINNGCDTALLQALDLSVSECATDRQLRSDLGVVQLLWLHISQPLHQ